MNVKTESVTLELDRLNALLAWWGIPNANSGSIEGQMKHFQILAFDLQSAYGDAYRHQIETMFTANERLARSLQGLLHCRKPHEIIAVESNILATILEGASLQARIWADLVQKAQDCCAALTRERAKEVQKQSEEAPGNRPPLRPAQASNRDTVKQAAHA